jgi:molybdenum cofactor cytidylyltransferase
MISSILLAAGQSLRMNGENKLIKEIDGIPLIKYAVKNILGSAIDELIIVLGHEKEVIESTIEKNKKIKFVYNDEFKNGLSSSIKTGLNHISNKSKAFFICLGDMPNVNQNIYNKLIKSKIKYNKKLKPNHRKEIIIPTYNDQEGNPVLFSIAMKNKIMKIDGDNGAKKIIDINKNAILHIPFDSDGIILDFDTQENFKALG